MMFIFADTANGGKVNGAAVGENSAILFGPLPHSGASKGKASSIITKMETEEGYPFICRMGEKSLKITKTSFQRAIGTLKAHGIA